jgi:hypothetical protein
MRKVMFALAIVAGAFMTAKTDEGRKRAQAKA